SGSGAAVRSAPTPIELRRRGRRRRVSAVRSLPQPQQSCSACTGGARHMQTAAATTAGRQPYSEVTARGLAAASLLELCGRWRGRAGSAALGRLADQGPVVGARCGDGVRRQPWRGDLPVVLLYSSDVQVN
ncbi:unnamed protein product, partial [Urochloa humidicola]